jgi:toxin-antitoxin system PIN domain toxin
MNEARWLLDVNALIALISPGHVHHEPIHRWFAKSSSQGWATCPITENGAIRVLSQPVFAKGRRRPVELIELLRGWKQSQAKHHRFWTDDVSLSDDALFHIDRITSHKYVSDVYLLGLAARHGAKLVSFDRSLPWQAIRNGTAQLIETPLLQ